MISEHGEIIKEAEVTSDPQILARWLGDLAHDIAAIGLEAGPMSQWLHRGLAELGFDAVLMETRQVKGALKAMPIKTDRRDADPVSLYAYIHGLRQIEAARVAPCVGMETQAPPLGALSV